MDPLDPLTAYPEFHSNPQIRAMAANERWTVSSTKATENRPSKFPVDARCLLFGGVSASGGHLEPGVVRGAFAHDERCLVDLDTLTQALPNTTNVTYYLNSRLDGHLVMDIEADCPPAEAARLLSMLDPLYSELSMSGRGYHLLMPMPANFWDFPEAAGKLVLRHELGWWEILLEHWITFTRVPIPTERALQLEMIAPDEPAVWEDVFAELAAKAKTAPVADIDVDMDKPEIPYEDVIVKAILGNDHFRKLEDYGNDHSRYEFAVMGTYENRLKIFLETISLEGLDEASFDDNMRAWVVYLAAQQGLEPRPKHSETRSGMPFLLSQAVSLIARRRGAEAQNS